MIVTDDMLKQLCIIFVCSYASSTLHSETEARSFLGYTFDFGEKKSYLRKTLTAKESWESFHICHKAHDTKTF